jgi:hypothetical protein
MRRKFIVSATGTDLLRPSTCPSVVRVDGALRTPASLEGAGVRLAWFPINSAAFCSICARAVCGKYSFAPVLAPCGTGLSVAGPLPLLPSIHGGGLIISDFLYKPQFYPRPSGWQTSCFLFSTWRNFFTIQRKVIYSLPIGAAPVRLRRASVPD